MKSNKKPEIKPLAGESPQPEKSKGKPDINREYTEPDTKQDWVVEFLMRLQRFGADIVGVALIALALITLLGVVGLTSGSLVSPWVGFVERWLGIGSLMVILLFAAAGMALLRQRVPAIPELRWDRILALEAMVFSLMALLAIYHGQDLLRAEAGQDGGLVGWGLAELLGLALGDFLRNVLLAAILIASGAAALGLFPWIRKWLIHLLQIPEAGGESDAHPDVSTRIVSTQSVGQANGTKRGFSPNPQDNKNKQLEPQYKKNFKVKLDGDKVVEPPPRAQNLPPLSLLASEKAYRPDERHINLTAGLIEKTLAEFGIPARVIGFQVGPTVTQFAVQPGFIEKTNTSLPAPLRNGEGGQPDEEEIRRQKVRVAQISGLARDLALALSAERLRIEAPVPGRNYIGIEVPNREAALVRLRQMLESDAFFNVQSPLAVALGLDVSGKPVIADLAKMPHLLIAGTTGSGKSVCITAITMCLVMNNPPSDLRLVLIDPKKVELARFNGLPHILGKVETDLERIMGVLRWVVAEMDRRYRLLEKYRVRNIQSYNAKMRKRADAPEPPMHYIVVLVDELADLMMLSGEQTEPALVRLAQMARATGIHLVLATQRPSTDVVTGLIKANFPARLAFNVASSIDSRVILDVTGAETLLGKGDMLFMPPEAGSPIRAQGVMVSDQELSQVVHFWQGQAGNGDKEAPWDVMVEEESVALDRDGLVERAISVVKKSQRASASMLQRRLRIGYPRAARLIDELEELGVIGPSKGGGKERDVLIEPSDEDEEEDEELDVFND